MTDDHMPEVKELVSKVGALIDSYPHLKVKNFGLFYQQGRLGYMDLDVFAQATKVRTEENGEEKNLAELKKEIDKKK